MRCKKRCIDRVDIVIFHALGASVFHAVLGKKGIEKNEDPLCVMCQCR